MENQKKDTSSQESKLSIQKINLTNKPNIQLGNRGTFFPRIISEEYIKTKKDKICIFEKTITTQKEQQQSLIQLSQDCLDLYNLKNKSEVQFDKLFENETHSIEVTVSNQKSALNVQQIYVSNLQKRCLYQTLQNKQKKSTICTHKEIRIKEMTDCTKLSNSHLINEITHLSESPTSKIDTRKELSNVQSSGTQIKTQSHNKQEKEELPVNIQEQQTKLQLDFVNNPVQEQSAQKESQQQNNQQEQQVRRLTQQQKQELFNKRVQKERQQKFLRKLSQQTVKAMKFIERRQKDPRIKRSIQALPAKFKQLPKIPELLLLEINIDLINEIQLCQTYDCSFLNFLIPYIYLLASTLNFYEYKSSKNLSIYYVFTELMNKIKQIKNKNNCQLTQEELINHLVNFASYRKYTPFELNSMIGDFLKKHSLRMRGFIPAYYDIFYFHAFQKYEFVDSLQTVPDIRAKRNKIAQRLDNLWAQIRKKYHSLNL